MKKKKFKKRMKIKSDRKDGNASCDFFLVKAKWEHAVLMEVSPR